MLKAHSCHAERGADEIRADLTAKAKNELRSHVYLPLAESLRPSGDLEQEPTNSVVVPIPARAPSRSLTTSIHWSCGKRQRIHQRPVTVLRPVPGVFVIAGPEIDGGDINIADGEFLQGLFPLPPTWPLLAVQLSNEVVLCCRPPRCCGVHRESYRGQHPVSSYMARVGPCCALTSSLRASVHRSNVVQCQPLLITWDPQGSAGAFSIHCLPAISM